MQYRRILTTCLLTCFLSLQIVTADETTAWQRRMRDGDQANKIGNYEKAEKIFRGLLSSREKAGKQDAALESVLYKLGNLYIVKKDPERALQFLQRSLDLRKQLFGNEHISIAQNLDLIGSIYQKQKRFPEARDSYELALSMREKTLGSEHMRLVGSLNDLAALYNEEGNIEKAKYYYQRGRAIRANSPELVFMELDETLGGMKLIRPKIIKKPVALCSDSARLFKTKGKVVFSVLFCKDGTLRDVKLLSSPGEGLDYWVLDALSRVVFEPAQLEGKPIDFRTKIEFNFFCS